MEEDIKILEKFTKIVKGKDYNAKNGWHGYYDDELIILGKAIENLIKGYRELEAKVKRYEKYLDNKDKRFKETLENEYQERETDYIPISKIKEKIKELKQYKVNLLKKDYAKKQLELPNQNVLVCNAMRDIATTGKIQVLEELLGEEI